MFKRLLTIFVALTFASATQAATVIYDDGNFGGSFDGDDLGVLQDGLSLVRGSNDGTCVADRLGSVSCEETVPSDKLQSVFDFSINAGSRIRSIAISAGGFGPSTLRTSFVLELPTVPIFDAAGDQITSDLPFFVDGLFIGQSDELLQQANKGFLFPESEPQIPFSGPGPFSFLVFQGSSQDAGRFGVQWQVLIDVAPAPVPLPAGLPLLIAAIGVLGCVRKLHKPS